MHLVLLHIEAVSHRVQAGLVEGMSFHAVHAAAREVIVLCGDRRLQRTLSSSLSLWDTSVGNFPALLRPGPRRRGICLITASDAKKAAYFLAAHKANTCQGSAQGPA